MSFVGDALGFEKFHAKDLWRGIKKDPKRLLLGVDPLSTKVWNKVLSRKDDPLVDQLGGAYGGHVISAFGNNEGGVYGRAREAGIDTGAGEKMQDAAHVVAALFGGNGLSNVFSSGGGLSGASTEGTGPTSAFSSGTGFDTPFSGGSSPAGGMQQFKLPQQQQQQPKNTWLADELERQEKEKELKKQIADQLGQRYV